MFLPLYRIAGVVALCCGLLAGPARADDSAEINRLFHAGQTAEAFARLQALIHAHPKDARLLFLNAVLLTDAGRRAEAQSIFLQLTVDHPELPEPYNNLAVLYASQGDYTRARAALEAALRAAPDYAVAHLNLGDVYVQLARQSYTEALRLDPSNTSIEPKLVLLRKLSPATTVSSPAQVGTP